MAPLEALGPQQEGNARRLHVEVHAAVIVIGEERVVERHRLAGQLSIFRLPERAIQDQVRQNRLFLLPPRLAIMPHKAMPFLACAPHALHRIVPAAALPVHTYGWHDRRDLARQFSVPLTGPHMMDAHQVPGNL